MGVQTDGTQLGIMSSKEGLRIGRQIVHDAERRGHVDDAPLAIDQHAIARVAAPDPVGIVSVPVISIHSDSITNQYK